MAAAAAAAAATAVMAPMSDVGCRAAASLSSSAAVLGFHRPNFNRACSSSVAVSQRNASNLPFLSIRCARVGGIEIPNQKRIEISLQYIHGIGKTSARQILLDVELENRLTKELSEEDLTKLRDEVAKYMIEGDLRRFNALAIKRLRDIQCYRGRRHIMGLPCRGQHTKCNARTRKGKKVTVAGKKKAPGK